MQQHSYQALSQISIGNCLPKCNFSTKYPYALPVSAVLFSLADIAVLITTITSKQLIGFEVTAGLLFIPYLYAMVKTALWAGKANNETGYGHWGRKAVFGIEIVLAAVAIYGICWLKADYFVEPATPMTLVPLTTAITWPSSTPMPTAPDTTIPDTTAPPAPPPSTTAQACEITVTGGDNPVQCQSALTNCVFRLSDLQFQSNCPDQVSANIAFPSGQLIDITAPSGQHDSVNNQIHLDAPSAFNDINDMSIKVNAQGHTQQTLQISAQVASQAVSKNIAVQFLPAAFKMPKVVTFMLMPVLEGLVNGYQQTVLATIGADAGTAFLNQTLLILADLIVICSALTSSVLQRCPRQVKAFLYSINGLQFAQAALTRSPSSMFTLGSFGASLFTWRVNRWVLQTPATEPVQKLDVKVV